MTARMIVCIDDDPFYRELFSTILEPKGFKVLTAGDAAEGWQVVQANHPDLVTLDVMMPEQHGMFDGYGLLKRMREDVTTKKIPVVMISALGDKEDIDHGLSAGANDYLPKHEMTPEGLVKLINRHLDAAAAAATPKAA